MEFCDEHAQGPARVRNRQALGYFANHCHTAFLVPGMGGPVTFGCRALAEVVHQRGETHCEISGQLFGLLEHHHDVQAGIDLGVPLLRLRHTEQDIDLREKHAQCAAFAQGLEVHTAIDSGERQCGLLPHAFGHERIDLTVIDHRAHELHRLRRDAEAEPGKPGCESRDTQDTDGILDECIGDVAQNPALDIVQAVAGIDIVTVRCPGDGIDREVAA
jgi:hypothetical protein